MYSAQNLESAGVIGKILKTNTLASPIGDTEALGFKELFMADGNAPHAHFIAIGERRL
jgi:hypothetical protein